ncbi:hypothetical protein V6N13_046770 [Hibiscus sabdariffa]|uniref:Uncharacterized protein n=1 Tax=Hibiscus sabdariffa TaxID=183260 RepID=A0ABR1ZVE3_9ROSI
MSKHQLESDAFAEQMRVKDEKLEPLPCSARNGIEAAAVPRARTEPGYVQSSDKAMRCWDLKPLSCHKTNFINLSPHDPALLIHDALGHKSRS